MSKLTVCIVSRVLAVALTALVCVAESAAAFDSNGRNPFDPAGKPWTPPEPPLPAISAQDLQITGVLIFGNSREILAQLEGKLKTALPPNSAGTVRIAVGQSFGGGYVLESAEGHQVVVRGGSERFVIPVLRRSTSGRGAPASIPAPAQAALSQNFGAPSPAANEQAGFQASQPQAPQPAMEPAPAQSAQTESGQGMTATSPPAAAPAVATSDAGQAATPSTGQPKTLLQAIMEARAAAKAKADAPPPAPFGFPSAGK